MTLAHPAAVLLLRGLPLPVAPLVIGSMVPDVPMFLPERLGYGLTHSLLCVLTVDVVVALVALAVWDLLVRDALVDLSPGWVRDRFDRRVRHPRSRWVLAPAAAAVGALTHVTWDAFTHAGRWGVVRVAWLREEHLGLGGHQWAQYVSGVVGLAVVLGACVAHVRSCPAAPRRDPRALPAPVLPGALGVAAVTAASVGLSHLDVSLHAVAFHGVVTGIQAGVVVLALTCLAWLVAAVRRRGTSDTATLEA